MSKLTDPKQTFLEIELEVSANRGLFADHYLKDLLPSSPDWKRWDNEAVEALDWIQSLWKRSAVHFTHNTNESQTEHEFIRPILNLLWGTEHYQVQGAIKVPDGHRQTDYAFFPNTTQRTNADAFRGDSNYWNKAVALGDAKKWTDSLDKRRASDGSPSNQILNYLYFSKVRWGILTNGRIWRLYEQDRSRQGGVYYEVNLEEILKGGDLQAFKWFFLFFRRASFIPDVETGKSFIERVYDRSIDYAATVGDRLKDSVYDALRYLMNGFLAEPSNALDASDQNQLQVLHQQSLILLYRILFILYAEDRNLLKVENPFYKDLSLRTLQKRINSTLKNSPSSFLPGSFQNWQKLQHIFEIIDNGLATGNTQQIPAFNGGLFSSVNYPYISRKDSHHPIEPWKIGDEALAWAIDLLAYSHETWDQPGEADIDYTSLDVRHLGSIYEGLLELQPAVATESLIEIYDSDAKAAVFKPALEHPNPPKIKGQRPRLIQKGQIYLTTNRGERRASGSYYTPKYVVDYIAEQTVLPLLHKASNEAKSLKANLQKQLQKLESEHKLALEAYPNPSEAESGLDPYTRARLQERDVVIEEHQRRVQKLKWSLLDPFLRLRILDPAMGSGHFLVGVADIMSLYLATEPLLYDPEDLGAGPVEDPQLFYKRLVVERCLYGVDLNPLAVELAKLSLWLHSVSGDRALSFLDHHLRCGNSLVGVRLAKDLGFPPPILLESGKRKRLTAAQAKAQQQFPFAEILKSHQLDRFLQTFHRIVALIGGDAAVERQKHLLFRDMDDLRHQYRQVAHVWLAPFFGGTSDEALYAQLVECLDHENSREWLELLADPGFEQAQQLAETHRFFHWELEYPEVLLEGPAEKRGFDAVIGNPPYVRQELLGQSLKHYLADAYASYSGVADLYVYFMEQGHRLLRKGGRFGMITSNKYMRSKYGANLRDYLRTHSRLVSVIDFGELPVFEEAATFPSILISERADATEQAFAYAPIKTLKFDNLQSEVERAAVRLDATALAGSSWSLVGGVEQAIFTKMRKNSLPLGEVVSGEMYRGVLTGLNEAFVIDGATRERLIREHASSAELIKPFAIGDDIRKWRIHDRDRWLIRIPNGWTRLQSDHPDAESWLSTHYPAIHQWLKPFESKARKRWDKGEFWWELRACDYYDKFEGAKIVYPEMAMEARFSFGAPNQYYNNKCFFLATDQLWLLGFLNSKLVWLYLKRHCTCLGDPDDGGRLELRESYLSKLPVQKWPNSDSLETLSRDLLDLHRADQQERAGFWRWLETTWGIDFDIFRTQRSRLTSYEDLDFRDFVKVLKANCSTVDFDAREVQQRLETEWSNSADTLGNGLQRIKSLEAQLNQLVYDQYQLTLEEIACVEEQVG